MTQENSNGDNTYDFHTCGYMVTFDLCLLVHITAKTKMVNTINNMMVTPENTLDNIIKFLSLLSLFPEDVAIKRDNTMSYNSTLYNTHGL